MYQIQVFIVTMNRWIKAEIVGLNEFASFSDATDRMNEIKKEDKQLGRYNRYRIDQE